MFWVLALACACRESDDLAQTVVWIDAEPAAKELMSRVRIQAVGPMNHLEPTVETKKPEWPIKLVLAPKNDDASRRFTLHIEARDADDNRLMTLRFATGFVANQTRYVKVVIHEACVQSPATCAIGEACNVWSVELAANQLGRKAQDPRKVDATCTSPGDMPPPSDAGTGGTMPTDAGTGGNAGSGPAAGTGGAGSTGQPGICTPGYVSKANVCVDIDECATGNPCGDHGRCENAPGNYVCQCDPGYQNASGVCVTIEQCQTNNGGCQGTCEDLPSGVICKCPKNEWLKADRKSCGRFGPAKRVSMTASMQPMSPHFAFDAEGNGLAVWIQSDANTTGVWSRRYIAGTGWGTSAMLMADSSGTVSTPRVAMDARGRGVVVWAQTVDSDSDLWAIRYSGQTFGEPGRIDLANTGSAYDPTVELDDNGDGFAVWTQSGGPDSQIWANRFIADTGWEGAQAIATPNDGGAFSPQLAVDAHGNASVAWTESTYAEMDTPEFSPWAMRFDPATGHWRSAVTLDDNGSAGFPNSQLFGPEGTGLAVWPRMSDGRVSIRASSYAVGIGWGDSINIAAAASELTTVMPRVALSPSGIGAAIWPEFHSAGTEVWANRYDGAANAAIAANQWSGAIQLSSTDSTTAPLPQLAVDPSGNGFAVWSEVRGASRVVKAWRIEADAAATAVMTLSMDMTAEPAMNSDVRIDVDAQGNAIAIWDAFEMGHYTLVSSAFE
jgi:hypothetical protein